MQEKIAVLQPVDTINPYSRIIRESMQASGYEVISLADYMDIHDVADIPVVLNWYEEVNWTFPKAFARFLKRYCEIRKMILSGARLVVFIHNVEPHVCPSAMCYRVFLYLRRLLCANAEYVVVLCDETKALLKKQLGAKGYCDIEGKIVKILHPSYKGYYENSALNIREKLGIRRDSFVFASLGAIGRYKNIELTIQIARQFEQMDLDVVFLVAGGCKDANYLASLQKECPSNVVFSAEFVPDDEILSYMDAADCMLYPLDIQSSLNSGSCMLAASYGKNIVCPLIGTVKELPQDDVFSYEYRPGDNDSHSQALMSACLRAFEEWNNDKNGFYYHGQSIESYVDRCCSFESTTRALGRVLANNRGNTVASKDKDLSENG